MFITVGKIIDSNKLKTKNRKYSIININSSQIDTVAAKAWKHNKRKGINPLFFD